jgi:hypothetical protein
MKFIFSLLLPVLLTYELPAQLIEKSDHKQLIKKEDSLKSLAFRIIQGINPQDRLNADSLFTKGFVRALKTRNSFYFPFDSLQTISKLYAPDSSFRIFTWQMMINENVVRQHGAIQMKTNDGSLKLFPLIDKSDITIKQEDTIADNFGWIGAVYYKIILTKYLNQTYYTLLGFDQNNIRSSKKIIEVLRFKDGKPVFGGRYFTSTNASRYILEFKKESSPRLTYDSELDMIIFEHLISESNQPTKKWTLVGDGDYEGFKWVNGKWSYINKVFSTMTPENQEPVPVPVKETKIKPE